MHRYGGLPAWLAALAVVLLCAALSLYLALAMAALARWRCGRPLARRAAVCRLWLAAELARGGALHRLSLGGQRLCQVDGPLAALAPWIGVYGMGARGGASRPRALRPLARRARRARALAALALALLRCRRWALLAAGPNSPRPAGTLTVALLQTNVAQDEKFAAEHLPEAWPGWRGRWPARARPGGRARDRDAAAARAAGRSARLLGGLRAHFAAPGSAALVGVPLGSYAIGYTNSVVGLSPARRGRRPYRYDKTPPGALRRVHPHGLPLVRRADEHAAGRLRPRRR